MINITTIKSRSRRLLDILDSFAKAVDHDPRDRMIGRIRELERDVAALKVEEDTTASDAAYCNRQADHSLKLLE